LLGILGITALVRPIPVSPALRHFELPVMVGFALVLIVFGLRGRLPRWGSIGLLIGYVVFIVVTLLPK
jgi:cation:H+ antiporter